jgi:hypothetical protein
VKVTKQNSVIAYTNLHEDVLAAVDYEIDYAKALGNDRVESQDPHTTGEYLVMLDTYIAQAKAGWTFQAGDRKALDAIRKVAAIAVRCMTDNGVVRRGEV